MPRYDVETLQKGAGTAQHPLIPQNAAQMAAFADRAARRVQPLETIAVEVGGAPGRLMDLYRDGERVMGLVKVWDAEAGTTTRLQELEPGMFGLAAGTDLIGALMPRLVSREVIPARLLHRDETRVTGRVLDVWVNPRDPLHLMGLTVIDDTPAGLAMQELMAGDGELPALGGRSIEVDRVACPGPGEPLGELTGIVSTAVPRMVESRQEVQITEKMAAKGGSVYAFSTTDTAMSTVEMNTEQTAVERIDEQKLDRGAEEHGIPVEETAAKRQRKLEEATVAAMERKLEAMQHEIRRERATARVEKAKAELIKLENTMKTKFGDILARMRERKSSQAEVNERRGRLLDAVEKIHGGDAEVVDMVTEDPDRLVQVMDQFSFMAHALVEEQEAQSAAAAKAAAEEAAARQALEQRKQQFLQRATALQRQHGAPVRDSYSFPTGSTATSAAPPPPSIDTARYETDQRMAICERLGDRLLAHYAVKSDFSVNERIERDERLVSSIEALMKKGVPLSLLVPQFDRPAPSRPKRGREC